MQFNTRLGGRTVNDCWLVSERSRVQTQGAHFDSFLSTVGPMSPDQDICIAGDGKVAIQDHDNPLSQHGIASYVTKFESKSFRLHSNFGVAFAQRESCWRSQPSASASASVKVKGQGEAKLWQFF